MKDKKKSGTRSRRKMRTKKMMEEEEKQEEEPKEKVQLQSTDLTLSLKLLFVFSLQLLSFLQNLPLSFLARCQTCTCVYIIQTSPLLSYSGVSGLSLTLLWLLYKLEDVVEVCVLPVPHFCNALCFGMYISCSPLVRTWTTTATYCVHFYGCICSCNLNLKCNTQRPLFLRGRE